MHKERFIPRKIVKRSGRFEKDEVQSAAASLQVGLGAREQNCPRSEGFNIQNHLLERTLPHLSQPSDPSIEIGGSTAYIVSYLLDCYRHQASVLSVFDIFRVVAQMVHFKTRHSFGDGPKVTLGALGSHHRNTPK